LAVSLGPAAPSWMAQPCHPSRSLPLNRDVKPFGGVGAGVSSARASAGTEPPARLRYSAATIAAARERSRVRMVGYSGGSRALQRVGPGAAAGHPVRQPTRSPSSRPVHGAFAVDAASDYSIGM